MTGSHRHGALCPHQRLWLVRPTLGSSLASRPPHRVSHPAGPFPCRFHPQDPRALGPQGCSALLPDPLQIWTSHPCAGPGGRRFRHSPGRPTEGAPSPQRLRTPHGGVGGSWQLEEPQCLPSGFSPAEQRLQMPLEVGWLQGR